MGWSTGAETGFEKPYPATEETFDREDHVAGTGTSGYRVVIDPTGKLSWTGANLQGAELIVALTEDIPDSHLAGLRSDGASYLFAGETELDLDVLVRKLNDTFDITHTLLSGGPATIGAFLRVGLIDDISLLLAPAIDGADESPTLFSGGGIVDDEDFSDTAVSLGSVERLAGGMLWLRYELTNRNSD